MFVSWKLKGPIWKQCCWMKLLNILCSNQNSKLEHAMIKFIFHKIYINDEAQFSMINMQLKWHHIDTCKTKLQKVDLLT
jgi:hypothetical protein